MLFVVRHAMPAFGPDTPPHEWELGPDGRRGAESLRGVIPAGATLVSSPEPKARQTLEPIGTSASDIRFREVDRDERFDDDFRARRRAYLDGARHPGWEPHAEVIARFDSGVRCWLRQARGRPLVVATHGMAMTLWMTTVSVDDPGAFWSDLLLPDVFKVDVPACSIHRVVSAQLFRTS
jgi:broad specificity phosphatase PhoE